jgi:hypothetical protein
MSEPTIKTVEVQPPANPPAPMPESEGSSLSKHWPMFVTLGTVLVTAGMMYQQVAFMSRDIERVERESHKQVREVDEEWQKALREHSAAPHPPTDRRLTQLEFRADNAEAKDETAARHRATTDLTLRDIVRTLDALCHSNPQCSRRRRSEER